MKNRIQLISIIILLLTLLFSVGKCSDTKELAAANVRALSDTITYYKNRIGNQTASIKTLQLEKENLRDAILRQDKQLKLLSQSFANVTGVVKYETITKIDTIYINYQDSLPCIFERMGKKRNTWYSFNYKSNQKGIRIDSLVTNTETTLITGTKRKWFLGPQTLVTEVSNSNPHIKVTSLKAAEVTIAEPWYKKWYVWLAAGAITGVLAGK